MTGFSRYRRDALRLYGIKEVAELFAKRNLWALAAIKEAIGEPGISIPADVLLFALNAILLNCSKMYQYRPSLKGGFMKGTYYVPQESQIVSVWRAFNDKALDIVHFTKDIQLQTKVLMISTQSSTAQSALQSNSVDCVFTDPPYAEKVQYGELNFIWEAWLGLDTHWHDEEIIVNEVRGKTEADWASMMRQAMTECYRVLKPGRWLSLCYHDTSEGTWTLIQDIMADAGFLTDQADAVLSIDTGQKSYNQLTADKVNKRDLVINFRKPRPGELGGNRERKTAGRTFHEQVLEAIRDYLESHPGSTKDRIYDHVVSRLVRSGRMEAHDFDDLLRQVADEVRAPIKKNLFEYEEPNLFGTHEIRRWYLKETESGAEQSDQSVADYAAGRIEQCLIRQTEEELRKSQLRFEELPKKVMELKAAIEALDEEDTDRKRRKTRPELREAERQLEQLTAQRSEWSQHALHYTYVFEFYFPLTPKPRATLIELLEDYFYLTEQGNWRPPLNEEERAEKARLRGQAARRKLQRFCRLLATGEAIPPDLRPDALTLAEWIRYCKRSGLYEQGKLLYEKGGLNFDNLPEEVMVNAEEDYQVCMRMLARAKDQPQKPRRVQSKKKG